jgi:hypothetical protein
MVIPLYFILLDVIVKINYILFSSFLLRLFSSNLSNMNVELTPKKTTKSFNKYLKYSFFCRWNLYVNFWTNVYNYKKYYKSESMNFLIK